MLVEVRWLQTLADHPAIDEIAPFAPAAVKQLHELTAHFSVDHAQRVKDIEATTNHDVKAIEYFLKEKVRGNRELEKPLSLFPLRLHLGGHQQSGLRADVKRGAHGGVAAGHG